MAQTALFETPPAGAAAFDATGFEIGWDHAHYRLVPPVEHLHAGHPVRQGWQAGQAAFGTRTLRATRHVRRWLRLRLEAWRRGCAFEPVQVTPHFLAQIEVGTCPVTREALGHGRHEPGDAALVRVFDGAGYAAGNLAMTSAAAAAAKAGRSWSDALACARRIEADGLAALDGLDAPAWERLSVLMSFATPLAHARVASMPLLVLPPNRLRLINPAQALQALLTLQFTRESPSRRIGELAAAVPAPARHDFHVFTHTLLARRIAAGAACAGAALRVALEDAWRDPLLNRRWQRLVLQLTEADCDRLVRYAARRGLAGGGWQWLPHDAATDGWSIETGGCAAPAAMPRRAAPAVRDGAARWPAARGARERAACLAPAE